MSGIFGISVLDKSDINTTVLKNITKNLAVCLQAMGYGDSSSGLIIAKSRTIHTIKHNVSPKNFVEMPEFIEFMVNNITSTGGNTLHSISGVASNKNYDNITRNPTFLQPMRCQDIIGMHDGVVSNAATISEKFKDVLTFPRHTNTDSEIIFSSINVNSIDNGSKLKLDYPTTQAIVDTTRILKGTYACSTIDIKTPNNVWLFRKDRIIEIMYFKKEGIIIWASDVKTIRTAIENTDFEEPISIHLNNNSGICFNLEFNNYYRFDIGVRIGKSV